MPRGARSGPHPSLRIRLHATLRMQRFASGQIGTAATTAHFREIHSFPEGLAVRIGQPIVNCLGDGAWCPVGDSRAQLVELEARCEGPARRLAGVDRLHGLDEPGVERAAPPERRDHLLGECDAAERLGAAHVEQAARTRLDEALRRISQITVVRGRPDLVDRHVHRLAAAQLARQLVHEILADVLRPVHDVGAQNEGGGVSGEHRRFAGELRGPVDVERRRWVLLAVRAARVRRRDAVGLAAAAAGQGRAAREDVVSGVPDDLCADGGRGGGQHGRAAVVHRVCLLRLALAPVDPREAGADADDLRVDSLHQIDRQLRLHRRLREVEMDHPLGGRRRVGAYAVACAKGLDQRAAHLPRASDDQHAATRRVAAQLGPSYRQEGRRLVLGRHHRHHPLGHRPLDVDERVEGVGIRLLGGVEASLLQVQSARVVLEGEEAVPAAARHKHLLLVLVCEQDATPPAKRRRAVAEIGDHIVEGTANAGDELAVRRAVQPSQRVLLRR
mmetsp:Transcript_27953/g.82450  ORF Transcript_27953/g.82450 Transcript_27953/m.82450 type:complete len:502 (-) Transcript_27953:241-1746(-)